MSIEQNKALVRQLVEEVFNGGNIMTWSGTQTGEFMGIPSTGKHFAVGVFDVMRIEDGKFVEHWGQMDSMGMMQQLGG